MQDFEKYLGLQVEEKEKKEVEKRTILESFRTALELPSIEIEPKEPVAVKPVSPVPTPIEPAKLKQPPPKIPPPPFEPPPLAMMRLGKRMTEKDFWKNVGPNLWNQFKGLVTAEFPDLTPAGLALIPVKKVLLRPPGVPTPTPKEAMKENLEEIKKTGITLGEFLTWFPKAIYKFNKNPSKFVEENPLDTFFLASMFIAKGVKTARGMKVPVEARGRLSKELASPIEKVEHMYEATEVALKQKTKVSPTELYHKTKRNIVDVSGNIKRELLKEAGELGEEAVMHHELIRGAPPKAGMQIENAVSNIYGDLNPSEIALLNRVVQSKRTMAISAYKPEVRHPHGLTGAEHLEYVKTMPKKITQKADAYFEVMSEQLTQLHKEGLLSDALYNELRSQGDYSPRRFIQYIDPDRTYTIEGKKVTVPDSGLKRLTTGSEQVMEINSQMLLSDVIARTQTRIFKNRANQALHQVAIQFPDNGIVRPAKVIKQTKEGAPVYEKPPAGHERITVMVKGQEIDMLMPREWAKEWVTADPLINAQFANIIGWVSGSKILKPMATGLNPGFAITNFPRDIALIWVATGKYSAFPPRFLAQMGRDLITTFPDVLLRKGRFKDYINEGGGMQFLTHQGRITKKTSGKLQNLQQVLGYVGETSELWTRLALRERALRRGDSPTKATWIARNYLDFSQGGNLIKAADSAIPYLNAAVQATRAVFRSVHDRPVQSMAKFASLGTLATGLYLGNRFGNPECWNSIPSRVKVNSWIITTPFKYTDKEGNVKYLYFKIAKDQAQRVLATVFENLMAKALGDKVDGEQIAQSVADFIPYNPVGSLPPTLDAMLGYFANKDFWTNEDIWKGSKVIPKEEYTRYTHPMLVKTGELTGLSPERLRHVLQQYFTYGNIYTSLVGEGLNAILGQLPEQYKDKTTMEIITKQPIIRRMLSSTRPGEEFRQELDKLKMEENTRRFVARRELDNLATEYFREKDETEVENQSLKQQIFTHIKAQPEAEQGTLVQRFHRMERLYRIPDRGWWLTLASMPPEARATAFFSRWVTSDEEEKKRLRETMIRVPGIRSDRFDTRLVALFNKVK